MWKIPVRVLVGAVGVAAVVNTRRDPNNWFWTTAAGPALQNLDAEESHKWFIKAAKNYLLPRLTIHQDFLSRSEALKVRLWGLEFSNPVGIAAGLDKHAEAMDPLLNLGFGFVEVGSITPKPQPGNPQPRVFRLLPDKAIINRYGFNSEGLDAAKVRLEKYRHEKQNPDSVPWFRQLFAMLDLIPEPNRTGLVGVNVGCNKDNASDPGLDYAQGIEQLGPLADYLVVNISSPNTPGLRAMQKKENLENLIKSALEAKSKLERKVPLLVKIAPDLTPQEMGDIADIALRLKVDGLVVSNTTVSRPIGLESPRDLVDQTGGLSGAPLKTLAQRTLSEMYKLTKGQVPLIGVGGISSGQDAYDRIKAGASLVQLYTGITYEGIGIATKIHSELVELMKQDGYTRISQVVGSNHRRSEGAKTQSEPKK